MRIPRVGARRDHAERYLLLMIAAFMLMSFFLNRTTPGHAIIAIGGNEEAVRLAGINVRLNTTLAYVICPTLEIGRASCRDKCKSR